MLTRILSLIVVASALLSEEAKLNAAEPTGLVVLTVTRASAERLDSGDIIFKCEAVLDNDTGKELTIKSPYYSVFDGLDLTIFDEAGRKLLQKPYVAHQSFFKLDQSFPLKTGKNSQDMVFPVRDLLKDAINVKVLLVGTLPGSKYSGVLCSDIITVQIPASKK